MASTPRSPLRGSGHRAATGILTPRMPPLVPDEDGLPRLHLEVPQYDTKPIAAPVAAEPPPPTPPPPTSPRRLERPLPTDTEFTFLCGEGIQRFVATTFSEKARAKASPPFGYFRAEGLSDFKSVASELPNPFRLIMLPPRPANESPPVRYITCGPSGVTLWVEGMAVEVYPLDEWRLAHASFARVATKPILRACRKRYTFKSWRLWVRRRVTSRRRVDLLHAMREPLSEVEAIMPEAVTSTALGPALEALREVAGWIRVQRLEPQQLGNDDYSPPAAAAAAAALGLAPEWDSDETGGSSSKAPMPNLGAANGSALFAAIDEEVRLATGAFSTAFVELRSSLRAEKAQPLSQPQPDGCKFLLEIYSPRNYPLIAPSHFNTPAPLGTVRASPVFVPKPPPVRSLRPGGRPIGISTLDRWIEESSPRD